MNISLPDPMKDYVESQVTAGSYSSVSEYMRELVRADQKRYSLEQLEGKLLASLNSGEPIPLTPELIESLRHRLRNGAKRKAD
jgi:antitoxin ParD1/3/4